MQSTRIPPAAAILATVLALAAKCDAQCSTWSAGFARPGLLLLNDTAAYDAGSGEQFYVAGQRFAGFSTVDRWTGTAWENVFQAPGLGSARCLATGVVAGTNSLFLGTQAQSSAQVWRWDGSQWTNLATVLGGELLGLEVIDDGSGAALYAFGAFSTLNGGTNSRLAKWNGGSWSALGAGLAFPVGALTLHDDGGGPRLYAGASNGVGATSCVQVRTGASWSYVNLLSMTQVYDLVSWDWGAGPRLLLGGSGGFRVWDGSLWLAPGSITAKCTAVSLADLGSGTRAWLQGEFTTAGGVPCNRAAAFDGTGFQALGTGLVTFSSLPEAELTLVQEPAGPRLYASAGFFMAGGRGADHLAAWDGNAWSVLGRGFNNEVRALLAANLGVGARLHAAGSFGVAGDASAVVAGSATWNGSTWSALGAPTETYALGFSSTGGTPRLYAAGRYAAGVYQWNGGAWSVPGGGIGGEGMALLEHDDGSGLRLFVGGNFPLGGPAPGNRIAAWNGTSWAALASGMNNNVHALARYDEGAGTLLFAGGDFTTAGGLAAPGIARWNGSSWSALGGSVIGSVLALSAYDDGNGEQLYAGGTITSAGGTPVLYLARWNGTSWSNVPGGGANGAVLALHVHDDGRGPALYVGGGFGTIGGITAYNVARYDGAWESVDGGTDGVVRTFASFDDDGDGDLELFAGGGFQATGAVASGYVARLAGCLHHTAFCFGDGALADHTTPCPCGNNGAAGRGCAHSFSAAGARLAATGNTNPDTLQLQSSNTPANSFTLFLQHDAGGDASFHDGVLCAGGTLIRLRGRNAAGGAAAFPDPSFPNDATLTLSQRGQVTPGSGAVRHYAAFYRNASTTFCPPATANVTNGIRVVW